MSEVNRLSRARRLARSKGYLLRKLPDTKSPMDSIDVIECSIRGGECKASRYDMELGHWRSHFSVYSGDIDAIERWLGEREPAAGLS